MTKPIYYRDIELPEGGIFNSYQFESNNVLSGLSLINIFVGANNCGKSRFLRNIFTIDSFSFTTNYYDASSFYAFINSINDEFTRIFPPLVTSIHGIPKNALTLMLPNDLNHSLINPDRLIYSILDNFLSGISTIIVNGINYEGGVGHVDLKRLQNLLQNFGKNKLTELSKLMPEKELNLKEKRIYIPILRGMRPISGTKTDDYKDRTINDYFPKKDVDIFTGLNMYQTLKDKLLGEPEDRALVRDFEDFLSNDFFNGKQITLIPREGKDTVHIKIGDEKQLPIYDLGDGLQNLIIILFNVFINKERCLIFIEEPELCMHPGLQRSLMQALNRFSHHQYFLTTHSNHFMDLSLEFTDVSIYKFNKIENNDEVYFKVELVSYGDHNLLQDLGVSNSSVYLSNATIWVEGITDRLYLRCYMSKYLKHLKTTNYDRYERLSKLKEDVHYSFVEYQGSNLVHWTFADESDDPHKIRAKFLCGKSYLIADGDIAGKGSREADYRSELGNNFTILNCKEIENLLPEIILRELAKEKFVDLGKDVDLIIFDNYSVNDFGIGKYLDDLLGSNTFGTPSGTIKAKILFCERALQLMYSDNIKWKLNSSLITLCDNLFNFIIEKQLIK